MKSFVPFGTIQWAKRSSSTVTYTSVYSDSEPWRFQWVYDAELQSPKAAPQSPEQAPPSPDYVPGPEHQHHQIMYLPLPVDASPTTLLPGYVADSDPLEEDTEEDPADYPTDRRHDDEEEEESSRDDDDDDEDEASEEDEEEEHLAPADSTTLPAIDHVPSAEDT
ncbi:hypothetical protein Tco_0495810 [Tanacetum coccineum]